MCIQDGDGIGWVIYYSGKEERDISFGESQVLSGE